MKKKKKEKVKNRNRKKKGEKMNISFIFLTCSVGNQFTFLSSEIGALTRLTKLQMENNQLHELPENIGDMRSLISFNGKKPTKKQKKKIMKKKDNRRKKSLRK